MCRIGALLIGATLVVPGARADGGYVRADDGLRLFYRSVGDGPETVIIPVRAWTSPYFDALAARRRLIYYDPRGRGQSEAGDLAHATLGWNLRDLEALRRALHIERFALIGWSGYGMECAAYAMDHPDRVTRLVQLAPVPPRLAPFMDKRGAGIEARRDGAAWTEYQRLRATKAAGPAQCVAYNRAVGPAFTMHPERADLQSLCAQPNEWPDNQDRWFRAFGASLDRLDLRSRIPRLTMPRLVVYPEHDLIPLDGVREWIEPGGEARLVVVQNADHTAFLDQPEALMKILDVFLSGHWPDD